MTPFLAPSYVFWPKWNNLWNLLKLALSLGAWSSQWRHTQETHALKMEELPHCPKERQFQNKNKVTSSCLKPLPNNLYVFNMHFWVSRRCINDINVLDMFALVVDFLRGEAKVLNFMVNRSTWYPWYTTY